MLDGLLGALLGAQWGLRYYTGACFVNQWSVLQRACQSGTGEIMLEWCWGFARLAKRQPVPEYGVYQSANILSCTFAVRLLGSIEHMHADFLFQ